MKAPMSFIDLKHLSRTKKYRDSNVIKKQIDRMFVHNLPYQVRDYPQDFKRLHYRFRILLEELIRASVHEGASKPYW